MNRKQKENMLRVVGWVIGIAAAIVLIYGILSSVL